MAPGSYERDWGRKLSCGQSQNFKIIDAASSNLKTKANKHAADYQPAI